MKNNTIIQPSYPATLPSSGKKVKYRPFTVKEEKSLLLALQEDDLETVTMAIKNTVSACTYGEIDVDKTPYYDIEYLFLQIRSKSVGELIELVGSCGCDPKVKTEFAVDIANLVVEPKPNGNVRLQIPNTKYTIEFTHPSIDDFVKTFKSDGETAAETVANCIISVYTDDEVMDWNFQEKLEFVESMTSIQQKDIAAYLETMPMVKLDANYKCRACGTQHTKVLSGFSNFFV